MISFFLKKPKLGVASSVIAFSAGILLAHREPAPLARGIVPLAIRQQATEPEKQVETPSPWKSSLDLSEAHAVEDHVEQKLEDGTTVRYTLDPVLQERVTEFIKSHEVPYGAAMIYRIDSGEVLAMTGFSAEKPQISVEDLCLVPWAPAASVFKLVTASALLERGVPSSTNVCYHGGSSGIGMEHIQDNARWDKSCETLGDAIAKSINPIIGKLTVRYLDQPELSEWANRYGFNQAIPFELPVKPSQANIPSAKLARARVAAGFWHSEMSVLHGAMIASVPATGGLLKMPHIVDSVMLPDQQEIVTDAAESPRLMSPESARALGRMMIGTTEQGSARRGFINPKGGRYLNDIRVAGKTGSLSRTDPYLQYSWFVGFAPAERPEVAFSVLIGNPVQWRVKASTVARVMLQHYFERKPLIEKRATAKNKPAQKRIKKV